jgi:RNA polymerase sigma factor (sigma-70 family)
MPESTPGGRFPFLTEALADQDAAERLGKLLSDPTKPDETEDELIQRIQNELIKRTHKLLCRLFPSRRHFDEPWDLVKDFSATMRRSFLRDGMNMESPKQLFKAATQRIRGNIFDHLRRERRDSEHAATSRHRAGASASREAIDKENLGLALEAIDRLDPETRSIFDLKLAGLTYEQIEADLGLPASTAQRRWGVAASAIEAEVERLTRGDAGDSPIND